MRGNILPRKRIERRKDGNVGRLLPCQRAIEKLHRRGYGVRASTRGDNNNYGTPEFSGNMSSD